jgi:hypothetical protein
MDPVSLTAADVLTELTKALGVLVGTALSVLVGRALAALAKFYETKKEDLLASIADSNQYVTEARARTLVSAVEQYAKGQVEMRGEEKLALALKWAQGNGWPITRAHIEQAVAQITEQYRCGQLR